MLKRTAGGLRDLRPERHSALGMMLKAFRPPFIIILLLLGERGRELSSVQKLCCFFYAWRMRIIHARLRWQLQLTQEESPRA